MGKTSSSQKKKKRSKKSSKVRSRKISKTRIRKSKSKKLRHKDSVSDSSDDSRSSFSVSSYSSEDEYRSRRARSRTRKDVKSGKKRALRRSSSREDSRRVRKKKGLKKDSGSRGRKRTQEKKKKARRDASVSSTSSGSRSCSSFDSSQSEYERQKESEGWNIDKIPTERYRWMDQPTLYGQHTECSDHWIEEKCLGENNSRRLRSVITVIKQDNEGSELDDDEQHKEEIVCDHDDYPSCRSNDSNDGGSKKGPDYNSSFDSKKKVEVDVEKGAAAVSNSRTIGLAETNKDRSNPCSEARDPTGDPDGEDLESVLRRRALENLKKFRVKGSSDSDAGKQTLAVKVESFQNNPPEENGAEGVNATEIVEHVSMPPSRRDLAHSSRSDEKSLYKNDGANQSGSAMHDITCPPDCVAVSDNRQKNVNVAAASVTDKPKLVAAAFRRHNSSKPQTTLKQASASQKTHENLVIGSNRDEISAGDAQEMTRNSIEGGEGASQNTHVEPPSLKSPSEAIISNDAQDETKEASQYEQKTMSVMRGGEMVQVSYKVYIPKKTPALGRRQLKR